MKKLAILIGIVVLILFVVPVSAKSGKGNGSKDKCTTIQSGELLASDGSVIETGFDK